MLLDIVILPPAGLRSKIGKFFSLKTKKYPIRYVIDNRKLIPHMSLFHIRTSSTRFRELIKIVKDVIKSYHPIKISSEGYALYEGVVAYRLSNSPAQRRLNQKIVSSCYRLRTGEMPWTSRLKPKAWENRNRLRYGTQHNIGKSFNPHFTMASFATPSVAKEFVKNTKPQKFSFLGDTIAICEVNVNHQVTKIFEIFKLK